MSAFYRHQFEAFLARTGSRNASPEGFDKAFSEVRDEYKGDDDVAIDSLVEWYDYGKTFAGDALEVFEGFRAPRTWVTLVAMKDAKAQ